MRANGLRGGPFGQFAVSGRRGQARSSPPVPAAVALIGL